MNERYFDQVRLLLSVLPDIAREDAFALMGGTAINLFYRDMPRLSVDIDLTYLPVHDRERSLKDIDETLDRITVAITDRYPRVQARRIAGGGNIDTRILVREGRVRTRNRDFAGDSRGGASADDDDGVRYRHRAIRIC